MKHIHIHKEKQWGFHCSACYRNPYAGDRYGGWRKTFEQITMLAEHHTRTNGHQSAEKYPHLAKKPFWKG